MARTEFTKAIKVACVKRATRDSVVYCELCGGIAKKFQIDHRTADGLGGKAVLENAQLICEACYTEKNAEDTSAIAKAKRREALALGVRMPKRKLLSRPFPSSKPKRAPRPGLPPRILFKKIEGEPENA